MNQENQLTNLDLAKQIKEAGYPQEGLWFYRLNGKIGLGFRHDIIDGKMKWNIVAPTVAELGERLPIARNYRWWQTQKDSDDSILFGLFESQNLLHSEKADTEANARAKMWLYLKKENLL